MVSLVVRRPFGFVRYLFFYRRSYILQWLFGPEGLSGRSLSPRSRGALFAMSRLSVFSASDVVLSE